ncbi:UNVERIFIED_CONTAM: acyl-CoA dehydrogenase family protein [Microbacterium sp. SLM126]
MSDKSYLDLPFFDPAHRQLETELDAWCGSHLRDIDHHDADAACRALVRQLGEAGWLRYCVPAAHGGALPGLDSRALCLLRETLARHDGLADFAFAMQGLGSGAITLAGSDAVRARYLPRVAQGQAIAAFALSEPEAGSAVTELKTSATPDGEGFRINGTKIFTTHGPHADVILAYVRFGPGVGGIGSVLIDTKAPGVRIGQKSRFMSGEEWAQIYFEDVYVAPQDVLLGEGGFKKQIAGFNVERMGNTARSLALGRYAYEVARQWALQRKQFGRLLCEFQGLQWKFAEMKMKLDAGQLLLYRAASNADSGLPSAEETAIAKAFCNQAGFDIANEALQVMGGMGYSQEELVEYCQRRCRGWMIAGGSIEILKNRIAEAVFERTFPQRP